MCVTCVFVCVRARASHAVQTLCRCGRQSDGQRTSENGDELQKHWYKALIQCNKHHYWRLQTYTCTGCHALAYMTDTLYIVLCYLHSVKEAMTQLTHPPPLWDAYHWDTQSIESPLCAAGGSTVVASLRFEMMQKCIWQKKIKYIYTYIYIKHKKINRQLNLL